MVQGQVSDYPVLDWTWTSGVGPTRCLSLLLVVAASAPVSSDSSGLGPNSHNLCTSGWPGRVLTLQCVPCAPFLETQQSGRTRPGIAFVGAEHVPALAEELLTSVTPHTDFIDAGVSRFSPPARAHSFPVTASVCTLFQ